MVAIIKTMLPKHAETLSPWIKEFRTTACSTPLPLLPQQLSTFPTRWPFPRGDLYHWIPLLNRFDVVLEKFCATYKLNDGPQTCEFERQILESSKEESSTGLTEIPDLDALGYGKDGDRQLVESILNFSRVLLQNCGNRAVYASSQHLNNLLHSTSLSIIESTLSLGSELAQRYQSALKRMNVSTRHISQNVLQQHYHINLDRVVQLALPFTKTVVTSPEPQPGAPTTPSVKGKEKAVFSLASTNQKTTSTILYANDLASMVKGANGVSNSPTAVRSGHDKNSTPATETGWEQWGDVKITYYPKQDSSADAPITLARAATTPASPSPVTPTPVRRSSNLGPQSHRSSRHAGSEDSPSAVRSLAFTEDTSRPAYKVVEISSTQVKSTSIHTLLEDNARELPKELHYELLTKLRLASALTTSIETRRQILAIRLLAVTNLAYIYPEATFLESVLKQDSEEPRRMQLAYQLADMVHPPADGDLAVPVPLQTLALSTLEALSAYQSKFPDVCAALNTTVNHGVLLYVVRKAVAEMSIEEDGDKITEKDEWRDSLFSLLSTLSLNGRTGSDLVTAGLIPILVEVLSLRTNVAECYHPKILSYLDNIMYSARDTFQALVSADGLDAVSNLIVYEVRSAAENAAAGKGIPAEFSSAAVDYTIPFYQQQTLKWLFKFIHHMMSTAGGYGGNFDRLLRNLIDSSPLLGSLRQIMGNSKVFGSIVWTNSVSILNDFINNEPTSFAIIAEAGLSKGFLEAVTGTEIPTPEPPKEPESHTSAGESTTESTADTTTPSSPSDNEDDDDDDDTGDDEPPISSRRPLLSMLDIPRSGPLARGIMPTSETINIIPQAFGALCLNNSGMKMLQSSRALEIFFEIFESPEHVKCMDTNKELPANLGGTFDELVRHHPPLKTAIMNAILDMVARVGHLCKTKAEKQKIGAKLWTTNSSGKTVIANSELNQSVQSLKGKEKVVSNASDMDVDMQDAGQVSEKSRGGATSEELTPNASLTPFITAVGTFLVTMLSNSAVRTEFCAKGGIEFVLDLVNSPCLTYDFSDGGASRNLHNVIALLAEPKPHLTIPSLLQRALSATETLSSFANHQEGKSFFAPFVNPESRESADPELLARGTDFAKAFVNLHSLLTTLNACFSAATYNARNTNHPFMQMNLGDYYVQLVKALGPLLGAALREEVYILKLVPSHWKHASRVKDTGFGETTSEISSELGTPLPAIGVPETNDAVPAPSGDANPEVEAAKAAVKAVELSMKPLTKSEQSSLYLKNFQTLQYLLSKVSKCVSPFFQTLGKALVLKRNPEAFQKQNNNAIAKALAESIIIQLAAPSGSSLIECYTYWIGALRVLKDVLTDTSRHTGERAAQVITIVLLAFKDNGGFDVLNGILETFTTEIQSNIEEPGKDMTAEASARRELATAGTRHILSIYAQIVNGKCVTESQQTGTMAAHRERERSRTDQFSPSQFIVELRMAVLPITRRLWQSDLIEKGSSQISEKLIEVIRTICLADNERDAFKRSDPVPPISKVPRQKFKVSSEGLATLTSAHSYDVDLANEALYRCNNTPQYASEYCREVTEGRNKRNPIPEGDLVTTSDAATSSRPRTSASTGASTGTATPDDNAMAVDSPANLPDIISQLNQIVPPANNGDGGQENFSDLINQFTQNAPANEPSRPGSVLGSRPPSSRAHQSSPLKNSISVDDQEPEPVRITVDDLNEEREAIREDLIDKCLDVINAHGDVTFEIADLISTAVAKSSEAFKTVGTTLVVALMSFAGEEDLRAEGKKIAAYANLLALMLREKAFYTAAITDLKENLGNLLSFVRLSPNHSVDEPSPWIAQILLVIEMLLSADARPRKTIWAQPADENEEIKEPVLDPYDPAVTDEARIQLFEAILDILPRIGKDEGLALAVLRILVILTRTRSVAELMGEKKNIQRLFVMAKQLAGASSARIQGPLMIILRHIIEDDETVKQIMRSEIKTYFDSSRPQRAPDVQTYLRALAHTAIRNTGLFVETTREMVKFTRWTFGSDAQGRHSPSNLMLKEAPSSESETKVAEDAVTPTVQATEDLTIQDVKVSTEAGDSEIQDVTKTPGPESKLPIVEKADGVIHFLLCELLNYKDVEDKDPAAVATAADQASASTPATEDVQMAGSSAEPIPKEPKNAKASPKQELKGDEHPIYIYRCFILQCLTELLSSYNRTKIEFINFKRSAPPQAMTPSKPRSSVVNYLLFDLIPIGTLDHAETTALKKKAVTSTWADSVITALLAKTGEKPLDTKVAPYAGEDESDLLFVRKFVLENILRAYKEASSSPEPLDIKYARMLALSDLMTHIMSGKENIALSDTALASASQKQLRRIMFEKGFISALTASIADVDLNFPNAKRAVKYILRPLKTLSTTAIQLSDLGLVSGNPGQNEEDEIESATSVSDPEDEREETPDLFRNSTLGMFEPGHEGDTSSESEDDDEEMYEGEYDEEMDYEEEDAEDNISDEDEAIDGMGPIEGLPGDVGVEVIMDEDDDDDDDSDEEGSSGDDHDSEDDDGHVEIIEEGEDGEELGADDDMDDWESDDNDDDGEEEDYEGQADEQEELRNMDLGMGGMAVGGSLSHLVRAFEAGGDDAAEIMERMEEEMQAEGMNPEEDDDADERIAGEYVEEGDEDDDDEDEDDMDEDEMLFEQGYAMDGPGPGAYGWEGEVEPPILHRRPRPSGFPPFPFFTGREPLSGMLIDPTQLLSAFEEDLDEGDASRNILTQLSTFGQRFARIIAAQVGGPNRTNPNTPGDYRASYRTHRPGGGPTRAADNDGTNPLLQRGRDSARNPASLSSFMQALSGAGEQFEISGRHFGEPAERNAMLELLMGRHLPSLAGTTRNGAAFQFSFTTGPGQSIPPELQALFGPARGTRSDPRRDSQEPGAFFTPQSTTARWLEEAKLLFAPHHVEKAMDIANAILAVLVPPAIEAETALKAAEAERVRKAEEEKKKQEEAERIAREAKEAEEKAEREKKEAEEREAREAAERAEAEARAARGPEPDEVEKETNDDDAMDGVETEGGTAATEEAQPEETPAADRPRITTMIRGNPFDITDLGIDADFLAELPEEIREEVIMSAVAERRSQAAVTGAQPSDIDQEFLNALPDDIRDEIIQQERQDRRRREREERNRQVAAAGGPASNVDMDAASILATLPPALRQQVLLEQDDEMLSLLPQELAEQARAAQRDLPTHHGRGPAQTARRTGGDPRLAQEIASQRPQRRAIVQMLDKPGIATLLRLMFIFQHGSLRTTLNSVLQNISMNRHNRTEVLSTILHILQDGSFDMSAVERSFAHLSLRAKQPKDKDPKTPQSVKRTLTGMAVNSAAPTNLEASPLMVVQQCLSALVYLTQVNPHIPAFFLTEHEPLGGLKRSLSRKGKGKETKSVKYPLNSLLTLLDRQTIMESSQVMESLSTLLNMTTSPLQALQRKQKEAAEEAKKAEQAPAEPAGESSAAAEATATTGEQQVEPPADEQPVSVTVVPVPSAPTSAGGDASTSTEARATTPAETTSKEPEKESDKKQRQMIPPVIPDHNLKLVINIFVARECSSKTFRETLSTIKNLSAIPGAKAIFGRELIAKAQGLGELILVDLVDLIPQINKASTGTEIQGVALAKFSPGGSGQNKLLRVLTALDHLFDPKRDKKDGTDGDSDGDSSQLVEKQDLLSSLYENSTFGPMWEKLSECLRSIRDREHMQNVATILLPLIEALMVVCKNTTLKDAPASQTHAGKELMMTSPPPESRMESLFFTFTEEHRKILNDLVRQTPKLMSGTFSLLVKNPKVLEFDNKRNYFNRSVHAKTPNGRQSFPPLQLSVRRDQVFHDSYRSLFFQTGDQMKYGKLSIRFHGEEGVDAGGVTREWFQVLSRQMFDPGYALFIPVSSDRTTFHPNQLSGVNEEHLNFFKFIGRIIGKALYEGRVLDCHFSRAVYKRILGRPVSVKDMESLDPEYYKSLVWMLENDITDVITETFSVDNDKFGVVETIDFIENGRNIPVTEENKHEYIRLMVEWRLTGSVKDQLDNFLKGFHDIIPAELIAIFNEQELELLISGLPEIDVDDWKSNTEYHNYSASSPQIQWFWRAIRSYDKEERAKLLQFVTGTSKVPLNGFRELEGMNGFSRFNIHRDYGNKDRLPSSHTCFNQLDLPEYESYEQLRQQVLTAITAGSEYFGFA